MTITVQAVYAGGALHPLQPLMLKEGETVEVTVAQPGVAQSVEERFRQLAAAWEQGVAFQSSSALRNNHPAYRAIIALGPEVVPFLLRDLEQNQTHWFCALREITGADPIPASAAGNIPKMAAAWLHWAREKGYQW